MYVQQYESLLHVTKCILVLFHDQSQGFSVNKALMNDNMQEKTVINRRSVKKFMQSHKLKSYGDLKKSVLFPREHCCAWLEKKRHSFRKARERRSRS